MLVEGLVEICNEDWFDCVFDVNIYVEYCVCIVVVDVGEFVELVDYDWDVCF